MINKKIDINYLITKLLEFYEVLENYIKNHSNQELNIIIYCKEEKLKIKFIKDKSILLDYIEIKFNKNERKLYEYTCLSYMFEIFKNNLVFNENNKFYNKIAKPQMEFIADEPLLLTEIIEIAKMINSNKYNEITKLLENKYYNLKRINRTIDNSTKECLDLRLVLTKRLLRSDIYG